MTGLTREEIDTEIGDLEVALIVREDWHPTTAEWTAEDTQIRHRIDDLKHLRDQIPVQP